MQFIKAAPYDIWVSYLWTMIDSFGKIREILIIFKTYKVFIFMI